MRVAFFPNHWRNNPYLDLLEASLCEIGVDVYPTEVDRPYREWSKPHRAEIDVLHFHWLYYMYQSENYRESLIRVLKFAGQLAYAKRLGYRIVWTMHNRYPHERPHPHLDQWGRWLILGFADAVLVHCGAARSALKGLFGSRSRCHVAPLGNYIGVYPNTATRKQARRQLGIGQQRKVLLHLGYIRGYKGLENLVRSFMEITDDNLTLLIAGTVLDDDCLDRLKQLSGADSRVSLHPGWVPDDRMQLYYRAADLVVCPYERVLTSSACMLALSFGRPVVAPAQGCIPELVTPEAGILYDTEDPQGLHKAILESLAVDLGRMSKASSKVAKRYTWRATAEVVRAAYAG
jgi:beta-1,4-mannosyltransferase